jgi:hypothetical protein
MCGVRKMEIKDQHWFPLTISASFTLRLHEAVIILCDIEMLRNEFCELLGMYRTRCCILYVLISGLFNDTFDNADSMESNDKMNSEQRIEHNVEGSGRTLR